MRCGICSPPFYFITQDISPQKSPQTHNKNHIPNPSFKHRAKVKQLSVNVMSKDWPDSMALTLQQIDDVKTSGLLGHSDLIKQLPLKMCPLAQLSASDCRKRVELDKVRDETNQQNTLYKKNENKCGVKSCIQVAVC